MSIIRNLILATTLLGLAATASAAGRDHTSDKKQPRDWTGIYIKEDQANRGAWTGAYIKGKDRKSVVLGKSVSVRVDLGGRRIIKKKNDSRTKEKRVLSHSHHPTNMTHTHTRKLKH